MRRRWCCDAGTCWFNMSLVLASKVIRILLATTVEKERETCTDGEKNEDADNDTGNGTARDAGAAGFCSSRAAGASS